MINETVNKYLDEKASRKEAMEKLIKVIDSVNSEKQIKTAANMIKNFVKLYGPSFWSGLLKAEEWYDIVMSNNFDRWRHRLLMHLYELQRKGEIPSIVDVDSLVGRNPWL